MTPYAACFPFELRLYPKHHAHDFALMNDRQLAELGISHEGYAAAESRSVLKDPAYNFILHTSPPQQSRPGRAGILGLHLLMIITGISSLCRG